MNIDGNVAVQKSMRRVKPDPVIEASIAHGGPLNSEYVAQVLN